MTDVSSTLNERGSRYGDWSDNGRVTDALYKVFSNEPNFHTMPPYMRQGLHVIAHKIARILNGDPYYEDNWHDIQGYARLVEERAREANRSDADRAAAVIATPKISLS